MKVTMLVINSTENIERQIYYSLTNTSTFDILAVRTKKIMAMKEKSSLKGSESGRVQAWYNK